jgi:hypothetical protein
MLSKTSIQAGNTDLVGKLPKDGKAFECHTNVFRLTKLGPKTTPLKQRLPAYPALSDARGQPWGCPPCSGGKLSHVQGFTRR